VLIDVRPKDVYEKAHPEGAKNAALFRKFELGKTSFTGLLRATALALNGVSPVEPNPDFGGFIVASWSYCSTPDGHELQPFADLVSTK
jgi:hypothetical protein